MKRKIGSSRSSIGEAGTLEQYLDNYLQAAGLTFEKWIERFGEEPYSSRNELILKLVAPLEPKRIFEFACAGGYLAKLLLENIRGVELYTCSNFSTRVIDYCRRQLAVFPQCEVRLLDADVKRARDIENSELARYDMFVTTSFEHIEHDRELIRKLPENSYFIFSLAGFSDPEHFRVLITPKQIRSRYRRLLTFISVETIGLEDKKFVTLARTRGRRRWPCPRAD